MGRSVAMIVSVCLSVCLFAHISQASHVQNYPYVSTVAVAQSSYDNSAKTLCTSSFVDGILFSHSGTYGSWHWQYGREQHAAANGQNFQRIHRQTI